VLHLFGALFARGRRTAGEICGEGGYGAALAGIVAMVVAKIIAYQLLDRQLLPAGGRRADLRLPGAERGCECLDDQGFPRVEMLVEATDREPGLLHHVRDTDAFEKVVDLGFVGEPEKVDTTVLDQIIKADIIPVLAPVAASADGGTFNVNADTFAGAIAGALGATRLLLLTDVPGILDKNKNLIEEIDVEGIRHLIADGTITGGMIPKVETCIYALERGVEAVVIMDGKVPHAVLLELLTNHGAGTLIRR